MLLPLFLLITGGANARTFNITHLIVPQIVPPGQDEVEIECRYDANFTLLNWFKGNHEFFRYKPGAAPSTRSFPILGVGRVEMLLCGPTACRLRLGGLTEEASGVYKCDIEHDVPPYKFESRSARMEVQGHVHRKPLIEGLAAEYGEGDVMQAICRGAPGSDIHWYMNGHEVNDMRGAITFRKTSTRLHFLGVPPSVTLQCAEFRYGKLSGSNEVKARWKDTCKGDDIPEEQRNGSNTLANCCIFICVLLSTYYNVPFSFVNIN